MLVLARWSATFDYHSQSVRRTYRRMRDVRRNEKRLSLTHEMIDDAIAFTNADLDVPLELVKILFRIDQVKIVPSVRTLNHHHKKIAPIIQVTITHWRLKLFPILLDPLLEINRRLHRGCVLVNGRWCCRFSNRSHQSSVFHRRAASNPEELPTHSTKQPSS